MSITVEETAARLEALAKLSRETGQSIVSENVIMKALYEQEEADRQRQMEVAHRSDPNSVFIDPSNVLNYLGTRAKPSPISFAILRQMALRMKPVAAIIQTRLNEVARFTKRPRHDSDTGFRIVLKNRKKKPNIQEEKRAFDIEEAFLKTGSIPNRKRKDNLNMFVRKIVRDSLTLDAMVWENVPNRIGDKIVEWWAVDAATIEPVVDSQFAGPEEIMMMPVYEPITRHGQVNRGNLAYIQRVQGNVVAEYTEEDLAYGIRNPRTDVDYALYGLSELELLIETVTAHLNAEKYNSSYFTHSNLPEGLLSLVGKYKQEDLDKFRREWQNMVSGVVGKRKVPMMATEEGQGINFVPFRQSNRDMEFGSWLEYLTTISCAIYQTDPAEIGMRGFSASAGNSTVDSDAQKTKIDNAKDKGFIPLMTFVSDQFNQEIMDRIAPDFEFQWVGLDPEDEERKVNIAKIRLEAGLTVPLEERATLDIENTMLEEAGVDTDWMTKPINQVASQYVQGTQQAAQAQDDHQRQLDANEQTHGHAKEMEGIKHGNAKDLAQNQHGHKLEQTMAQGANQKDLEAQKANTTDRQAADDHGRSLEMAAVEHAQTNDQTDHEAKHEDRQAADEHGRNLETLAVQHEQAKESGDLGREHDSQEKEADREVKREATPKKAKGRKLTKGITIEILE